MGNSYNSKTLTGNYFVSNYPPFSLWSRAQLESFRSVLLQENSTRDSFGLYVHTPFCVQRCSFCYYLSYDDRPQEMRRYTGALLEELRMYGSTEALKRRHLDFVYFGGGTPSLLPELSIRQLLSGLQNIFPWNRAREVTFECAPRSVTLAKMKMLRELGVNRISLGIQQLNDGVLQRNGRLHLCKDVVRAFRFIREAGFDFVNVDLIVGLAGQTDQNFLASLKRVIALEPENITIYQLEIPFNTPLYRMMQSGLVRQATNWNIKRDRLQKGFCLLEQAGYALRSAYTAVRNGHQHSFLYQDEQYHGADLLGIGTSSFSYISGINQQNISEIESYIAAVTRGELPLARAYALNRSERMVREFVLQLKLGSLQLRYFREKFDIDPLKRFGKTLNSMRKSGLLDFDRHEIRLTREGLLAADHLIREFYLPM